MTCSVSSVWKTSPSPSLSCLRRGVLVWNDVTLKHTHILRGDLLVLPPPSYQESEEQRVFAKLIVDLN